MRFGVVPSSGVAFDPKFFCGVSCDPTHLVPCCTNEAGGQAVARKLSETVQLKLRFSEELRRKLEKAAERNNQSINSEIIARMEASFRKEEIRDVVKEEMVNFYEAL